jgi:hypothetical protein
MPETSKPIKSIHKSGQQLCLLWSLIHDLMHNNLCMHVSNSSWAYKVSRPCCQEDVSWYNAWENLTICESLWMSVCFLMRHYFISVACWTCITEKFGLTSHLMKSLNNFKRTHWKWLYRVAWWRIAWLDFFFFLRKATLYLLMKWIGFGCALAWPSLSPDLT